MTAANSTSGKAYNSLAYSADGRCVIAGGNSKYVVIYDVLESVMVKKFRISVWTARRSSSIAAR